MIGVRHKVLVVDDDVAIASFVATTLADSGCESVICTRAAKALFALDEHYFDLVITDIDMPEMNGIELFHRIHRSYPGLPVIFLSGMTADSRIIAALREGAFAFVTKDADTRGLCATVAQALRK